MDTDRGEIQKTLAMCTNIRFDAQFLSELESALATSPYADLAAGVRDLSIHSFVEGQRPQHQFIYVVDKHTLPAGPLPRIILPVRGLFCVFTYNAKIVALEILGRNVLDKASDGSVESTDLWSSSHSNPN
jgi:hypothetical protein